MDTLQKKVSLLQKLSEIPHSIFDSKTQKPPVTEIHTFLLDQVMQPPQKDFFLLHAAKVRSSCEEGPGQSALQSAYHNPKLDVTELKQKD